MHASMIGSTGQDEVFFSFMLLTHSTCSFSAEISDLSAYALATGMARGDSEDFEAEVSEAPRSIIGTLLEPDRSPWKSLPWTDPLRAFCTW